MEKIEFIQSYLSDYNQLKATQFKANKHFGIATSILATLLTVRIKSSQGKNLFCIL